MNSSSRLHQIARGLAGPGRGILAADESNATIEKRFKSVDVANTPAMRMAYREALFGTPGLDVYISGAILFDETIHQTAIDGTPLSSLLENQGIVLGVKVDLGLKPLAGFPGESVTEGLDGLRDRLRHYGRLGAQFAKWRAVYPVTPTTPSPTGLEVNAHTLARFAALCQESELVPLVEPEVLMDGDHPLSRHAEVTTAVLHSVFSALDRHHVRFEDMLLKTNMVLPGADCPVQAPVDEVADATLAVLRRCVPAAVPGIMFLSGGQDDVRATEHLNALNRRRPAPWELSFSFGRALQAPALQRWAGRADNVKAAQRALLHRARCNSAARCGTYDATLETSRP